MKRSVFILSGTAILALVLSCASPEERMKKTVLKLANAIEKKSLLGIEKHISANYQDEYGFGKREVLSVFKYAFDTYKEITVSVKNVTSEFNEDITESTVSFETTTLLRLPGDRGWEKVEAHIELSVEKRETGWLIMSARGDEIDPVPAKTSDLP